MRQSLMAYVDDKIEEAIDQLYVRIVGPNGEFSHAATGLGKWMLTSEEADVIAELYRSGYELNIPFHNGTSYLEIKLG